MYLAMVGKGSLDIGFVRPLCGSAVVSGDLSVTRTGQERPMEGPDADHEPGGRFYRCRSRGGERGVFLRTGLAGERFSGRRSGSGQRTGIASAGLAPGHYGPSHPFWVSQNDYSYSQHIFIYKQKNGAVQPVWMSSSLNPRVESWSLETDGRLHILTPEGEDTLWGWETWGLERLDASPRPLV